MIADAMSAIADVLSGIITAIVNGVNALVPLFWDGTLNSNAGGFTFLGYIFLIGLGLSLVTFVINFFKSLSKVRK